MAAAIDVSDIVSDGLPAALPPFTQGGAWRAACVALGIDSTAPWGPHTTSIISKRASPDPALCDLLHSWNLRAITSSPLLTFTRVSQLLVYVAALSFSQQLPPGVYPGATLPGVPVVPPGEGGAGGTGEAEVGVAALQDVCGAMPAVLPRRCMDEWPALKAGAVLLLREVSVCASGLTGALFDTSGSAAPPAPGTVTGVTYSYSHAGGHGAAPAPAPAPAASYGSLSFAGASSSGAGVGSAGTQASWGSLSAAAARAARGRSGGSTGRHGPDAVVKYLMLSSACIVAVWPPASSPLAPSDAAISGGVGAGGAGAAGGGSSRLGRGPRDELLAPHNPWVAGDFA